MRIRPPERTGIRILRLPSRADLVLGIATMKATTILMAVAGLVLCQTSCQTQQKIEKNQLAAHEWLNQQNAVARVRVSGNWFAEGWGRASLKQSGRQITGTLDTYEVKGVVSGGKAYLTTWDSGKCYYALVISPSGKNSLSGTYTDGPAYKTEAKQQRQIELRRSY
ncbi:MAG: hypothetical protein V4584_17425 [Verrucomicrobiota bacterium]